MQSLRVLLQSIRKKIKLRQLFLIAIGSALLIAGYSGIIHQLFFEKPAERFSRLSQQQREEDFEAVISEAKDGPELYGAILRLCRARENLGLATALKNVTHTNVTIREAVAEGLSYYETDESLHAYFRMLRDSSPRVRAKAIEGLGRHSTQARKDKLDELEKKKKELESLERAALYYSLYLFAQKPEEKGRAWHELLMKLREEARQGNRFLVSYAIKARPSDVALRKALYEILERGKYPELIELSMSHLRGMQDPRVSEFAEKLVTNKDPKIQKIGRRLAGASSHSTDNNESP